MRRTAANQSRYPVLRKLAGGAEFGLTTQVEMPPTAIDRGAMAVLAIISTEDVDRSQDVVSTAGIRLEQHMRSPVGLYDHGEHWTMPVSKYETPEGEYTVKLLDGYATGRAYYDQHNAMSEQVFGLIDRGFLRGHSIGFRPLQARKRNLYDEGGYRDDKARGLYVEECELLEVSAVPVADNPNCVAIATEVLHKGRLCGRPLLDVVRKSLASYATPVNRNQVVGGWTTQTKSHQPEEGNQDYGSQSLLALVALSGKLGGDDDDAVKRAMQLVVDGFEQGPDVDDVDGPSDPVVKAWSITKGWRHAPLDRQGASQNRYINTDTGKVAYFAKPPRGAEKASGQPEGASTSKPAAQAEKKPVKGKAKPEAISLEQAAADALESIKGHLAKPEGITSNDLQSVADTLSSGLKKEQLQAIARGLQTAVSGVKTAIAVRIAEAMLKKAKGDPGVGKKATGNAMGLPDSSAVASAKLASLGNETGNSDLLQFAHGGKDFVIKPSQMGKQGAEQEQALLAIARKVGLSTPQAQSIERPDNIPAGHSLSRMQFDDDAWQVMEKVPGRHLTETDLRQPRIAGQVINDTLFAYALGYADRNLGNLLVDASGKVHSIDFDSAADDDGTGSLASHLIQSGVSEKSPLSVPALKKILAASGEIAKHGDEFSGARIAVLAKLAGMKKPTLGDLARFTGSVTDSQGRKYQFVDGKRVAQPEVKPEPDPVPAQPDDQADDLHGRVLAALKGGASTLPELYDALSQSGPVSVGEFHDTVRDLEKSGAVSLDSFRGHAHELQRSGLTMSGGGKILSGIKATGKPHDASKRAERGKVTPEATAAVSDAVRAYQDANPFRTMGMDELYRQVSADHPMSVGQFHEMLRGMEKRGEVELHPFTRPLHELPDSSLALMQDQEPKYYIAPGSNRPAAPAAKPAPNPAAKPVEKPAEKPQPLPEAKSPYVGVSGAEARTLARAAQQRSAEPATKPGDHYAALGVKPDATDAQIKAAFREAARKYHPDRNPGPGGEARYRAAKQAFETLTNPAERDEYDQQHSHASRAVYQQRQTQQRVQRQHAELRESLEQARKEKKGSWMPWTPGLDRTIRRYEQALADLEKEHPTLRDTVKKSYRFARKKHSGLAGTPNEWPQIIAQAMLLIAGQDAKSGDGPLSDKALSVLDALREMQHEPDPDLFDGPQDALFKSYAAFRKSGEWVKEEGKRGGNRWRRGNTVRYFPRNVDPNKAGRTDRAGVQARKESRQAMTAESVHEQLADILDGTDVSEEAADKVHGMLSSMYRNEVRKLGKLLGTSQTGEKRALALKVAQAAVERAKAGGWKRAEETSVAKETAPEPGATIGSQDEPVQSPSVSDKALAMLQGKRMTLDELESAMGGQFAFGGSPERNAILDLVRDGKIYRDEKGELSVVGDNATAAGTLTRDEERLIEAFATGLHHIPNHLLEHPEVNAVKAAYDKAKAQLSDRLKELHVRWRSILDPMQEQPYGFEPRQLIAKLLEDAVAKGTPLPNIGVHGGPDGKLIPPGTSSRHWEFRAFGGDLKARAQDIANETGNPVLAIPVRDDRSAPAGWAFVEIPVDPGNAIDLSNTFLGNQLDMTSSTKNTGSQENGMTVYKYMVKPNKKGVGPNRFNLKYGEQPIDKNMIAAVKANYLEDRDSRSVAQDDSPKEGDRNAEGLVLRGGRWRREGEEEATAGSERLDVAEVARRYGVAPRTVTMLMQSGAIQSDGGKVVAAALPTPDEFTKLWTDRAAQSQQKMRDLVGSFKDAHTAASKQVATPKATDTPEPAVDATAPTISRPEVEQSAPQTQPEEIPELRDYLDEEYQKLPKPQRRKMDYDQWEARTTAEWEAKYGKGQTEPAIPMPLGVKPDEARALQRAAKEPKPAPANVDDVSREIQRVYGTAAADSTTREQIDAAAARLAGLSKPDLMGIAESLGMVGMHTRSREAIRQAIHDRILARKGATQRSRLLDREEKKPATQEVASGPAADLSSPEVKQFAESLRHTIDKTQGDVALYSAVDEAAAVAGLRQLRPDLKPVDVGAAMDASMREQAAKLRVQWSAVEQAMAPGASESDRRNLLTLANRALPKALEAANDDSSKNLIHGVGDLARYGLDVGEVVGSIKGSAMRDTSRKGESALVLVPDGADVNRATSRQAQALPVAMGGKAASQTPPKQQTSIADALKQMVASYTADLGRAGGTTDKLPHILESVALSAGELGLGNDQVLRLQNTADAISWGIRSGRVSAGVGIAWRDMPLDQKLATIGRVADGVEMGSQRNLWDAFTREVGKTVKPPETPKPAPATPVKTTLPPPQKAVKQPQRDNAMIRQVSTSWGTPDGSLKIRGLPLASLRKEIQGTSDYRRGAFGMLAKEHGLFTNGKIILRLLDKERSAFADMQPTGAHDMAPATDSIIHRANSEAEADPARIVKVSPDKPSASRYLLESPAGNVALVNARNLESVRQRYPDATIHLGPEIGSPVVLRRGDEVVGIVMPLT